MDLIRLFDQHNVNYVIVGALALAAHGIPRFSADYDFFVEPEKENGLRVHAALEEFAFRGMTTSAEEFARPNMVFQFGHPPHRIDIITSISGVSFDEAYRNRLEVIQEGVTVKLLGIRELMKNKEASGREKDLADLALLKKKYKDLAD